MFWSAKVIFVHPPRTGGTFLTEWAQKNLPWCSVDWYYLKHATRPEILQIIPQMAGLQAFTIKRDDDVRFESWLRHCRTFDIQEASDWTEEWRQIVDASRVLSDAEFRQWYFRPMTDYLGTDIKVFDYEPDLANVIEWLQHIHYNGKANREANTLYSHSVL